MESRGVAEERERSMEGIWGVTKGWEVKFFYPVKTELYEERDFWCDLFLSL